MLLRRGNDLKAYTKIGIIIICAVFIFSFAYVMNMINAEEKKGELELEPIYKEGDIYKELITSYADLTYGIAEFTVVFPDTVEDSKTMKKKDYDYDDILSFEFLNGERPFNVDSYEIFVKENKSKLVPTYDRRLIEQTCIYDKDYFCYYENCTLTKEQEELIGKEYDCSYNETYENGTRIVYYNELVSIKGYKFKPNAKYTIVMKAYWKPQLGERSTDWIAETKLKKEYIGKATDELVRSEKWTWWNTSWGACRNITIPANADLTDFPFLLVLNSTRINYTKTQDSGQDLRIVSAGCDMDGSQLPHEIEFWNETGSSFVWFKGNMSSGSATTYSYYYDNSGASDGQNATNVWDANYVVVHHMNDLNGSTSHKNDIVNSNTVQVQSNIDGAYNFTSGQYMYVPWNASSLVLYNMTYEVVINFNVVGTDAFKIIMQKLYSGSDDYIAIDTYPSPYTKLRTAVRVTGTSVIEARSTTALSAGNMYHFAGQRDGLNIKSYMNGALEATQSGSSTTPADDDAPYRLSYPDAAQQIKAQITEFRISNIARSTIWLNQTNNALRDTLITYVTEQTSSSNTAPTVTLSSPVDNYNTSDTTPDFTFSFIDAQQTTANCSLYANSTLRGYNATTNNNTATTITSSTLTGGNQWYVSCNDGTDTGTSTNRTITIDASPPQYNNSTASQNTTYGGWTLLSLLWSDNYDLDDYLFSIDNATGSYTNQSWTDFEATTSGYSNRTFYLNNTVGQEVCWKVYANDTVNNFNTSEEYCFTITSSDSTPPYFITIPADDTKVYGTLWAGVYFNATDETEFGSYSVNDTTNFVINSTGFLNWTNYLSVGNYYVNVTINDTNGNENSTIYNLNITKKDLNVTADDKNKAYGEADPALTASYSGFVLSEDEGYLGGSLSLVRNTGETVGTYDIVPSGYTSDNYNITFINGTFTITKSSDNCNVLFNDTSPVTYGETFNVSTDCTSAYTLYRNGTEISNNSLQHLAVGDYNFTVMRTDTANYTNIYDEEIFTVNKDTAVVHAYINNTISDFTAGASQAENIYLNGTLIVGEGDIKLYLNGSLINEGASPLYNISNLTIGEYYFNVTYDATENYTATYEAWFINITDDIYPLISWSANSTASGLYNQFYIYFCADITEDNIDMVGYSWNGTNSTSWTGNYCENKTELTEGEYVIYLWVNDTAGNYNETTSRTIILDRTSPEPVITFPTDNYNTTDTALNISWEYGSPEPNEDICWWSSDEWITNTTVTCEENITSTWSEGSNHVIICANDTAGNMGCTDISFNLDTTYPLISISSPANSTLYSLSWFNITGTATDSNGDSVVINCTEFGSNLGTFSSWNFTNTSLSDGNYSCLVTANDTLGHNTSSEIHFRIDNTAPVITITYPADNSTNTTTTSLNITGTITEINSDTLSINCSFMGTNVGTYSAFNYTNTSLNDGSYTCTLIANDTAGNTGTNEVSFKIDITAPIISGFTTNTTENSADVSYSFTATDALNDISMCLIEDNQTGTLTNSSWYSYPFTYNTTNNETNNTLIIVNIYCNDSLGNLRLSENNFTIEDTSEDPETSCSLTINSPLNTIYTTNYIILDTSSNCTITTWYYDIGSGNWSFTPVTSITGLSSRVYILTVWGYDGTDWYTATRTFTIDLSHTGSGGSDTVPFICYPNWKCTQWSSCLNYEQIRICTDENDCGVSTGKPAESRECSMTIDIPQIIEDAYTGSALENTYNHIQNGDYITASLLSMGVLFENYATPDSLNGITETAESLNLSWLLNIFTKKLILFLLGLAIIALLIEKLIKPKNVYIKTLLYLILIAILWAMLLIWKPA